MQIPAANLRPNRFHRLVGYGWTEVDEVLPEPILRSPRPKRVAQKIELLVRITDQPNIAESDSVVPAPLTIHFVQKNVGQRRRNHAALRRTSVRVSHLAFLHDSR